jgi:hypothetical protein
MESWWYSQRYPDALALPGGGINLLNPDHLMAGKKKAASSKTKQKAEFQLDPMHLALVASSLMPRMQLPEVWSCLEPEKLARHLAREREGYDPQIHLDDPDGTARLDVIMQEAVARARLLLHYAGGSPSPTKAAWAKMLSDGDTAEEAVARVRRDVAGNKDSEINISAFLRLVLINSNDDSRQKHWRAFQAAEQASVIFLKEKLDVRVIWEKEATLTDIQESKGGKVRILKDDILPKSIPVKFAGSEALKFYEFYIVHGNRITKQISRETGRTGGRKTQRKVKQESQI